MLFGEALKNCDSCLRITDECIVKKVRYTGPDFFSTMESVFIRKTVDLVRTEKREFVFIATTIVIFEVSQESTMPFSLKR